MRELLKLPYTVKLTKDEVLKHEDFINKRINDSKVYKKRGGFKVSDLIVGLSCEIGAFKALSEQYEMMEPDTMIYSKGKKSFDADLYDEFGRCFHIKGQSVSSIKKYGPSWLFQRFDPIFKDEKNNEYLVFCGCTLSEKVTLEDLPQEFEVDLFSIAKIEHLQDLIHDDERTQCKVWQLRNTKKALYLNDVIEEVNKFWDKTL